MKKLMIAAAIAGAVGMAQADFSPLEGFETWTAGQQIDISQGSPYYWNASGNDTNENYEVIETVVTNYLGTGDTALEGAGDNFLALTGVELLERYVLPQTSLEEEYITPYQIPAGTDGGVYIDTLVKFTVTEDDAPAPSSGDKLCIWVGVVSNETTGAITTNLMVTAGHIDGMGNTDTTPATYTTSLSFTDADISAWHRLTVRAVTEIDEWESIVGFVISVDGDEVSTATETISTDFLQMSPLKAGMTAAKVFPSIVAADGINGKAITSVGFKGSGAIDNLQFSETDPNPSQDGWKDPIDPAAMAEITNKTAAVAYPSLAGTALANADAVKLTLWATDPTKGALAFADAAADNVTTATVEAFLLNCAVDDVATEKAEFTVNITWDETDQEWKVTGPSNKTYNGTLTIKGSPDLTTPKANWDEYDPTTDKFMFGVLEF